jgi:hypothetical protein
MVRERMIFYTLLSHYHDSDKANLVLTSMIVYIIIYIALPDAWNGYALAAISILDYMALKLPPFDNIFKYISKTFKFNLNWFSSLKQQKKKQKHKKSKSKSKSKSKKVRFSAKNQYHEYNPWGQSLGPGAGMSLGPGAGMSLGHGSGAAIAPGTALNIPDWMLTPQQRIMKVQQTTRLNQLKQLQKPGFFIDNRHLTVNTDSESSDESIASDESSELSNWEEGI